MKIVKTTGGQGGVHRKRRTQKNAGIFGECELFGEKIKRNHTAENDDGLNDVQCYGRRENIINRKNQIVYRRNVNRQMR